MELRIRDSANIIGVDFGYWLIPKIRAKLVSNIKNYYLVNWDKYLTNTETIKRLYKKDYKAAEIIIFAANNLVCTGTDGELVIRFNDVKFIPGFDRLNLGVAVKTLNYGTLDIKGCSIFTDTLTSFADDIDTYVSLYYRL